MFNIPDAYELIKKQDLSDISTTGWVLRHRKTGARLALMENEDSNKVFYIAFRTPPGDSTGVAHILEHSVLCGSKKYPLKDPFVELVKGSLNTFLNAMTFPDKTAYPVASENDKDFANLMDVYMDAVLNPNIYENEKIFRQEGWHYEPSEDGKDLIFNGVVYNEMKGAYSSPDDVLEQEILNSLFPDNTYSYESGGKPEVIPDLTYEDFLDFHRRYYHPTNSFIFLYGNCDMEERLNYLDREYLSKYESIKLDSTIKSQEPFPGIQELIKEYPVPAGEEPEDGTFLAANYVVEDILDPVLYQAFSVLDYALLSAPGAPVRKALMKANIGKDIIGGYSNGTLQPYFTLGVKGAKKTDLPRFKRALKNILKRQVEEGIDKDALRAGINIQEFSFREADFGSYPKGLVYGLICMDSWIYDDGEPFLHLDTIRVLDELKAKVDTDYYENLIQKYFLDNTHATILTLNPKEGLASENEAKIKKRLDDYRAGLSDAELSAIKKECEELKAYQSEPTSPEALLKLPMLTRGDLKKEIRKIKNRMETVDGMPVLYHDVDSNGIIYLQLLFSVDDLNNRQLQDLSLAVRMMGLLDTKDYTYAQLANEINLKTGGVYSYMKIHSHITDGARMFCVIGGKFLPEHTEDAFKLASQMMFTTKWEDNRRIREQLNQEILHFKSKMMSAGHSIAANRAESRFSKESYLAEITSGIEFYEYMKDFEEHFDERLEDFKRDAAALLKRIFRLDGMLVSCTAKAEVSKTIEPFVSEMKKSLSTEKAGAPIDHGVLSGGNEGFKTAAAIQYVSRAGNFRNAGIEYSSVTNILRTILSYGYFWDEIRVKGGAYGCMAGIKRSGDTYFVSYRDPNLGATNDVFAHTPDFIEAFDADERDMTKYVIGTVSTMDTPLTPSQEGDRSLLCHIIGLDEETLQKDRDAVLNATPEDIRGLAPMIRAVIDNDVLCVLGNEDAIEGEKELFKNIVTLT